jgi:phage baseplate assembly protein W
VSTDDVLEFLHAVRDVLRTPAGARVAREIGALYERADEAGDDAADSYAARVVARALSRAERRQQRPARRSHRNGGR